MGVCLQGLTGKVGHGLHWCCGDRTVRESAPVTENRDWTLLLTTKHLINSKCFDLSSGKLLIEDLLDSAGSPKYLHRALTPLCGPD